MFKAVLPSLYDVVVAAAEELGDVGPSRSIACVHRDEFVVLFVGPLVRFLGRGLEMSSHEAVNRSLVSHGNCLVDSLPEFRLSDDTRVTRKFHTLVAIGMLYHLVKIVC